MSMFESKMKLKNVQLVNSGDVTLSQILDMNVITNSSSIRRVVIIAKDRQEFTAADGDLLHEWHQVVRNSIGTLTDGARGVGADGVEIAE